MWIFVITILALLLIGSATFLAHEIVELADFCEEIRKQRDKIEYILKE